LGSISQDPIGFQAGDANLYRYVENGPTTAIDPSGFQGVGHHWVTISKLVKRAGEFEKDALHGLLGAYSGALETAHNRRRMDGISHTEYDRAIERTLDEFLAQRKRGFSGFFAGKVTAEEAHRFAQDLYEGSVFDGEDSEKLRRFNQQVMKECADARNAKPPKDVSTQHLIGQGKAYATTSRGRQVLRAAKFLSIIGGALGTTLTAAGTAEAIGSSQSLREALRNIEQGNFAAAEGNLVGNSAGSLLSELQSGQSVPPLAVPLLEQKLRAIPGAIKEWEDAFCD
jgi:uncharacterized protein RhaS with RHS repeats